MVQRLGSSLVKYKDELLTRVLDGLLPAKDKIKAVKIGEFNTLREAIAALPADGGTVLIPEGRFEAGDWSGATSMQTPNVRLIGARMPTWSNDLRRLEGGSVITGRFNVWADNFSMENVGWDMGADYCDAKYPGANFDTASHPLGGTWDAFAFGPPHQNAPMARKSFTATNVMGLVYSPTCVAHALLFEGIIGFQVTNITAIYGVHGIVFKTLYGSGTGLYTYGQTHNGVIIKSNSYALCGGNSFSGHIYRTEPHGTAPWRAAPPVVCAVNFHAEDAAFAGPNYFADTYARGCNRHVHIAGEHVIGDVTIGSITTEGMGVASFCLNVGESTAQCVRIKVGSITGTGMGYGVSVVQTDSQFFQQVHVGSLVLDGVSQIAVSARPNSHLTIDHLDVRNAEYGYDLYPGGRLYVGAEIMAAVKNKFNPWNGGFAPRLAGTWEGRDASGPFDVSLRNYRIELNGLLKGGTSRQILALPGEYAPRGGRGSYLMSTLFTGSAFVSHALELNTAGLHTTYDPDASQLTSVDEIYWYY